jgi:hypothetical protein
MEDALVSAEEEFDMVRADVTDAPGDIHGDREVAGEAERERQKARPPAIWFSRPDAIRDR